MIARVAAATCRYGGAVVALAAVSAAYVLAEALTGAVRVPLDLDEAVYASQFSGDVPHVSYAAHRSPGQGLLAAPLTLPASSVPMLRAYFAVLSAVLLFLAYLPWLKVIDRAAVPVAAGLFSLSWVALRYGATVLPNLPVAAGAVAAAGLLARGGRRSPAGLFLVAGGLALLRPTDAVWIAGPLVLAALVLFPRRPAVPAAIAGGLAAGWGAWLAESLGRFGGPANRLAALGALNDPGVHLLPGRHLAALHGRESCPPSTVDCGPVTFGSALWWLGGAALALAGLYAARRGRAPDPEPGPAGSSAEANPGSVAAVRPGTALVICLAVAVVFGGSYMVLTAWAVPRYLLPMYALLSLPAAVGLTFVLRAARDPSGPLPLLAGAAVAVAASTHIGLQLTTARQVADRAGRSLSWPVRAAAALEERGVAGDCAVLGRFAPQIAYLRRCRAADMPDRIPPDGEITAAGVARLRERGLRVVLVTARRPDVPGAWEAVAVPGGRGPRVHLSSPR